MDSFRAFEDDAGFDHEHEHEDEPTIEVPPDIGIDERRMHVRAYNHWVSLLDGRPYPTIADLDPGAIEDFGPYSVLLDFSAGSEDPQIAFIGSALREECDLHGDMRRISDVPRRSLLSRLTDHYLQIISNCAPIGFEAEFVSTSGLNTMYRGILMPYSSDGDTIDFIYGVINWKEVADRATAAGIAVEASREAAIPVPAEASPIWADGPHSEPIPDTPFSTPVEALPFGSPLHDPEAEPVLELTMPITGDLVGRLCVAREVAEAARSADARSRSALYRALGEAYDFALASEVAPEDYARMLEDAGLTVQDRAPMTPVVKLVFGVGYDKTRLTEFAAALSYGRREGVNEGCFQQYLEAFAGGLKGVVAAERCLRRPASSDLSSRLERHAALRAARPLALGEVVEGGEFVLLVARREADGSLALVAPVASDPALIDRAIRKSLI